MLSVCPGTFEFYVEYARRIGDILYILSHCKANSSLKNQSFKDLGFLNDMFSVLLFTYYD